MESREEGAYPGPIALHWFIFPEQTLAADKTDDKRRTTREMGTTRNTLPPTNEPHVGVQQGKHVTHG